MTVPLDAELLKDPKGLGKPLSFDGTDADHQEFRFSFRVHMSLVSTVSHTLNEECEVGRNPISLAAVKALGDAHLKCCIQMYFSLALKIKGSGGVRGVRGVVFTCSLPFNARGQNCSQTVTKDPSDLHHTPHKTKPPTLVKPSFTSAVLSALFPKPKQRREEKLSAARCCSSFIGSIGHHPFLSHRRCTHVPARS